MRSQSWQRGFLVCGLLVVGSLNAQANEVIDLGNLEVQGDVRRPLVQLVESQKFQRQYQEALAKKSLKDLETELLMPNEEFLKSLRGAE